MTNPTTPEDKIEEVLAKYGVAARIHERHFDEPTFKPADDDKFLEARAEARHALLALLNEAVLQIIGDDIKPPRDLEDESSYRKGLRDGYNDAKQHMRLRATTPKEEQ